MHAGNGMADAFGMGAAYANGNNYMQSQVSTAVPGSTAAPGVGSMRVLLGLGLGPGSTVRACQLLTSCMHIIRAVAMVVPD